MKLLTYTLALLLLLFLLAPATTSGQIEGLYGKSYALVVGVDEYPHSEWPDLPFARKDAAAMARLLRAQGFDEVVSLYDEQATRAAIISVLEDRIAPKLQAEDRVLVFFSGHGTTKSFGGQEYGYVVPHDGTDTSATWLSMTALREMSQKLGTAKHHLFIFDSCFGGSFATKSGSTAISRSYPDYIQEVARRSARQFVTAGGRDQKVRAAGPHGYSFFTGYLLEALEEGLAETDGDGFITVLELAQYLQSRAANDDQTPGFGDLPGHGLGAFLFSAPRRQAPAVEAPKPPAGIVADLGLKGNVEIVPIEAARKLRMDVRLRNNPNALAAAVTDVARGSVVWVAGTVKSEDWLLVEYDHYRGFIPSAAVGTKTAQELLAKTVDALGGPQAVDTLATLFVSGVAVQRTPQGEMEVQVSINYAFPDRFRQELTLPMGSISITVSPAASFMVSPQGTMELPGSQKEVLIGQFRRSPLALLQARNEPGFEAVALGPEEVDGQELELVQIEHEGRLTLVGIDPETGRLMLVRYHGPGPGGAPGVIDQLYSDFREVEGLAAYPFLSKTTFDGEESASFRIEEIEANPEVDPAQFERPPEL